MGRSVHSTSSGVTMSVRWALAVTIRRSMVVLPVPLNPRRIVSLARRGWASVGGVVLNMLSIGYEI